MVRIALGSAAYGDVECTAVVAATAELGFTGLDLQIDSTQPFGRTLDADRLASELSAQAIDAVCVSNVRDVELLMGPHDFHSDAVLAGPPAAKIAHARQQARRTIELAARLDVAFVRFFFGCSDHLLQFPWHGLKYDWDDNVAALAERSAELFAYATASGVTICLEPHPRQTVYDLPSLLRFRALMATNGFDVGLCFDPANVLAAGHDPVAFVHHLDRPPEFVHFKDVERWASPTPPRGPGWKRYGPGPQVRFRSAGKGELPWMRLRDALFDLGFEGTVVIEYEDLLTRREVGIPEALEIARRLFDLDVDATQAQWW